MHHHCCELSGKFKISLLNSINYIGDDKNNIILSHLDGIPMNRSQEQGAHISNQCRSLMSEFEASLRTDADVLLALREVA